jgi:hypothetical protein
MEAPTAVAECAIIPRLPGMRIKLVEAVLGGLLSSRQTAQLQPGVVQG